MMFKEIIAYFQRGREQVKILNQLSVKGSVNLKSFIFSNLLAIIILLPFIVIVYNVFSLYDPSTIVFKIMLALSLIAILFFNSISSCFYVVLLKNYLPDLEDLKKINNKDVFIVEFFHPIMLILVIGILVFVIINYM